MVCSPSSEAGVPAADPSVADVLIVGYGPVGQVLSLLLAQRGWQVVVAEQWPAPYQMPRAVTFDGHAARIIAAAGAVDVISRVGEPSADYVIENASGQTLLRIELRQAGRHGWPDSTSMYQPGLEAALAARGARQPGLRVLRGQRVTGLAEHGPVVEAATTDTSTGLQSVLQARWVVGCDGANSCVRSQLGTPMRDFGFSVDWMACDITPFVPSDFPPSNLQVADPAGPMVAVSAGPGHRRWEFMRLPGEDPDEFGRQASAWRRLARSGVTPANARLDRHAVYTIGARCADRWRSGRILIAGDAAHQMPPFAGQGLCSGIRDAANLAWKLDLVLRGGQDGALLDTYECERKANVEGIIRLSVWLGNLICMTGQAEAAERDAAMLRSVSRPGHPPEIPDSLTSGLLYRDPSGARAGYAGALLPQALVTCGGRTGWFDQLAGPGFVFLAREDPASLLDQDLRDFLDSLGTRFVHVVPPGAGPRSGVGPRSGARTSPGAGSPVLAFLDVGHEYLRWLESMQALGVLVRPDFYLFGAGRDRAELAAVVAGLRGCLGPGPTSPKGDRSDHSGALR
jgi:flavoprotein hydroxylase